MLTPELAAEDFCYLSTTGRVTGRLHTIEIWFAAEGDAVHLLGSEGADWVRNLRAEPEVTVRIGERTWKGSAHVVTDRAEREPAARLVYEKYQLRYGGDLRSWRDGAVLVSITLR